MGNHNLRSAVAPHNISTSPHNTPMKAKPLTKFTLARQAIRCNNRLPASTKKPATGRERTGIRVCRTSNTTINRLTSGIRGLCV